MAKPKVEAKKVVLIKRQVVFRHQKTKSVPARVSTEDMIEQMAKREIERRRQNQSDRAEKKRHSRVKDKSCAGYGDYDHYYSQRE